MQREYSRRKEVYDRKIEGEPYHVGDQVWLYSPAVPRGHSRKFHKPWMGPFKIVKVMNEMVYRIQYVNQPRKLIVVHFNRLKPYKTNHQFGMEDASSQSKVDPPDDEVTEVWYQIQQPEQHTERQGRNNEPLY